MSRKKYRARNAHRIRVSHENGVRELRPPATAAAYPLAALTMMQQRWITQSMPVDWLNAETLRYARSQYYLGVMPYVQWLWEQMEAINEQLIAAIENFDAELLKHDLVIEADEASDEEQQIYVDEQRRAAEEFLSSISNIEDAIKELSAARRFGYTVLQLLERDGKYVLDLIPRWQICRRSYEGELAFNANASATYEGQDFPDDIYLIKREKKKPLHLSGMELVLNHATAKAQWQVYSGRYGTPPLFIEGPAGLSDEEVTAYSAAAVECISNSAGYLPNGSKVHVVSAPTAAVDLWSRLLERLDESILRTYTGSTLSAQSSSDTGALAGGAHADTVSARAESEMEEVCAILDEQLLQPILAASYGEDVHVRLSYRRKGDSVDGNAVADIATLSAAGYEVDVDQVTERTGWTVTLKRETTTPYEEKALGFRRPEEVLESKLGMDLEPLPQELLAPATGGAASLSSLRIKANARALNIPCATARVSYLRAINSKIAAQEAISKEALAMAERTLSMSLFDMPLEQDAKTAKTALNQALHH